MIGGQGSVIKMNRLINRIYKVIDKRWIFTSILFVMLLLAAGHWPLTTDVYAAPLTDESTLDLGPTKAPQAVDEGPTLFASMIKLFSGLAVVIAVLLVTYYFVREYLGKMNKVSGKGKLINVIATHYLAPKKSVMLIDVAGERLVIGVGDEINLLARIENTDVGAYGTTPPQGSGFSDAMKTATERKSSLGVVDSIKERLESLKGKR